MTEKPTARGESWPPSYADALRTLDRVFVRASGVIVGGGAATF